MSNKRQKTEKEVLCNETLVVAFQKFNGVFLAKISDSKGRNTHAYGKTKKIAEANVISNFQLKYSSIFQNL